MSRKTFKALVVEQDENGEFLRQVKERPLSSLPDNEVLIRVQYSSLNYKDALSASGNRGVTQHYPHTPGIDAAGAVEQSSDKRFSKGDKVIVTSYDLGQNTSGGFGEYIRVPGDWVVPLPNGLSLRESMIYGTAGFTAAYGVYKLKHNGTEPDSGNVLVTGATGGVGSLAVAILSKEKYRVIAATGKVEEQENFLKSIGAHEVINRDKVYPQSDKALLSSRWIGAIDTVGGKMLDAVIRQTGHNGTVACCGNVLGHHLNTSIYPFILRGVSLMGIDSGICLMSMRRKIWNLLAGEWKLDIMEEITREVTLENLEPEIQKILEGKQTGRVLLKHRHSD
ncbi:YhdH/YhfP family quinone oxidoreductase [Balneolaceae bacterium YR4-1]|uniref:YhdH/YhfP family quinone oxidoreductase n=1 Tax=Halalkalibaculum roseum TaxID=2709311 RepID=A0A6M1T4F6_9BACT|nr:YhdH/YhfP family quinone oxidoreductase [Halalkalibaculum roseum]NGP77647.1 YhdH/YhfP family quinone oxidoreductase [Halalkalibaculum roseum]